MKAMAVISTVFLFLNTVFSQPGSLDKTFGHDGIVTDSAVQGVPAVIALQADGKIVAASTYSLLDETPFKGNNFYRLKLVDKDGTASYTNITDVNIAFMNTGITLFPNPVKGLLQIQGLSSSSKTITVIDAKGKIIQQAVTAGNNYSINTKQLTAGMYFIKIEEGDQPVTLKFIKE